MSTGNGSFEDARQYLMKIKATYMDGRWGPNVVRKKISDFCKKIVCDPSVIALPVSATAH